jgi:hypothetical protein
MAGLALLMAARQAGLDVRADGECLVIRGPHSAAPLAQALLERKPCVLAALTVDAADPFANLRAQLACGCLRGYCRIHLPAGATLYDVPGYVGRRLLDLDDPRLAGAAAYWLGQLQAELTRLDAPMLRDFDTGGEQLARPWAPTGSHL